MKTAAQKKKKEIKVVVQLTEGYEKRFTAACLKQLARHETQTEKIQNVG